MVLVIIVLYLQLWRGSLANSNKGLLIWKLNPEAPQRAAPAVAGAEQSLAASHAPAACEEPGN